MDNLTPITDLVIPILCLVIVSISSTTIARRFQKINLPLITGLIFTGIICGPYLLGLVPNESVQRLQFINDIALAFIAFAAGAELYLRELRQQFNSIKWNTFGQLVVSFVIGATSIYLLADWIPYMQGMDNEGRVSLALLTGAIFIARSPASAIAVIDELRAKGPFVQTALGVTVLKDFLVIILFSVCFSVAQTTFQDIDFRFTDVLLILLELGLSGIFGFYVFGWVLSQLLKIKARRRIKVLLMLGAGYGIYVFSHQLATHSLAWIGHSIFLEPLLMCILASFRVTNYSRYRTEFLKLISVASTPVYVTFFTLTGLSFDITVLNVVLGLAIGLVLVRLITIFAGSYVGSRLAGDPEAFRRVGWMPYVTQAGVALGLSTIVANQWPEWGQPFALTMVAVIIVNQFIGPPLFKYAIFQVGEDRIRGHSESEHNRIAFIFGFEPQSVALARQLQDADWRVNLVTLMKKGEIEEPENLDIAYIASLSLDHLAALNLDQAEAIITMLSDQENLEICEMAYHKYGTSDLVVRLNHRYNSSKFAALNAKIVDPSTAIVSLLDHFVRSPQATSLLLGMEEGQDTWDIELRNTNLHGLYLRDLRLPADVIILSLQRGGQTIISHGYTRLRVNDVVTVVGSIKSLRDVQLKFDE